MVVWIVGNFRYPFGDAASNRITFLARALQFTGAAVRVITTAKSETESSGKREGVSFDCLGVRNTRMPRYLASVHYLLQGPRKLTEWLQLQAPKPDLVIGYGSSASLAARLLRWGRHNAIPVVFDVVEWYDPHQCSGGYFGPFLYDSEIFFRRTSAGAAGILAISTFLEGYFAQRALPVLRVPGLADVACRPTTTPDHVKKEFVILYSGFAGKKDLIAPIFEAAALLRKSPVRFVFTGRGILESLRLQGVSEAFVRSLPNIDIRGWLSQEELSMLLSSADAMIILRAPGRSSMANFPQKFAEYMAAGRPVIANNVGDMATYLRNGENGVLLSKVTGQTIAHAVTDLMQRPDRGISLGELARATAGASFDFRAIAIPLRTFVQRVIDANKGSRHADEAS